jgi:hypothetical protein
MKEIIDSNLEEDGGFDKGAVYICSRRRRGRVRGVNGKLVVIFCRIYFNYSIASCQCALNCLFFLFFVCVSMKFHCTSGQMERGGCPFVDNVGGWCHYLTSSLRHNPCSRSSRKRIFVFHIWLRWSGYVQIKVSLW